LKTLEQAREERLDREIDAMIAARLKDAKLAAPISPHARVKLRSILKKYAKDPHPFRACFVAGTPVDCPRDMEAYPDGVPIEQLRPGQLVWSFNSDQHVFELKSVEWVAVTRRDTQVAMLTLDDGTQIKATPDHRFMRRDGLWVELQDLWPGDSLMPLYRDFAPLVRVSPDRLTYEQEHRLVANALWGEERGGKHVHHRDERRRNASPDNLDLLTSSAHTTLHHRTLRDQMAARRERRRCRGCGGLFEPTSRMHRYCGECPASAEYAKTVVGTTRSCEECGQEFTANSPNHVHCSSICREYGPPRACHGCGSDLRGTSKTKWCYDCVPRKPTARPMGDLRICANCGSEFVPKSGAQRYCSVDCRVAYGVAQQSGEFANHHVVSVVLLDERYDVWDIEVVDNHSFVVGGVVVHNCVKDNLGRFGPGRTEAVCATLKDVIKGNKNWRKGGANTSESDAVIDADVLLALDAISAVDLQEIFLEARALEEHGTTEAASLLQTTGRAELERWGVGQVQLSEMEAPGV
jgi:hypothetical protein